MRSNIVRMWLAVVILSGWSTACASASSARSEPVLGSQEDPFRRKPPAGCAPAEIETEEHCSICNPTNPVGCKSLCDAGNGGACALRGLWVEMHDHDDGAALVLYERACSSGYASGCESLARMLLVRPTGRERAVRMLSELCDASRLRSCVLLGEAHLAGGWTEADWAVGLRLIDASCKRGDEEACQLSKNPPQSRADVDAAIRSARDRAASCKLGDPASCVKAKEPVL